MRTGFFPLLCCSLFTSGWKLVLLYVQGHYLERFCPQKHTVGNYSPWLRWGRYIFCCSRAENLLVVLTSDVPSSKWQKRHLSRWRNLVGQDPSRQYGREELNHCHPVTLTRILFVPAASVIRTRPSCSLEIQTVVCRTCHLPLPSPAPEVVDLTITERTKLLTSHEILALNLTRSLFRCHHLSSEKYFIFLL